MTWTRHENGAGATPTCGRRRGRGAPISYDRRRRRQQNVGGGGPFLWLIMPVWCWTTDRTVTVTGSSDDWSAFSGPRLCRLISCVDTAIMRQRWSNVCSAKLAKEIEEPHVGTPKHITTVYVLRSVLCVSFFMRAKSPEFSKWINKNTNPFWHIPVIMRTNPSATLPVVPTFYEELPVVVRQRWFGNSGRTDDELEAAASAGVPL